jgi:hypothetical protein
MPAAANRHTVIHELASALTPGELEDLKLARLQELRSTIDALRGEREAHDPLLAWVIEHEGAQPTRN